MTAAREQTNERLAAAHKTAVIVVTALTASIVVYSGAGVLILKTGSAAPQAELPYPFYAAAAALAIGSIAVRRAQLHRMKLEVVAVTRGVAGLIKHLLNATIIAAAVGEIIGLLALLVAFFGGSQNDVIRLGAVALMVSILQLSAAIRVATRGRLFFGDSAGGERKQTGLVKLQQRCGPMLARYLQ